MNILLVTGKKHLRNLIFLLLLTALVPGLISAQSRGVIDSGSTDAGSLQPGPTTEGVRPEEPEVELPTVVLEYTAIQREELEIILPDEDLIALPELEQQLPDAGSLRVESPSFELGLPKQPQTGDFQEPSFFSEGTIGAGSDNHLIGDIALYKRGDFPLYQFRFSHDGIDGYGENSPGTGYFDRREELSGSIEMGTGSHTLRSAMDYMEQETGLQDYSGAYSVVHRFLYGTGEYVYSFESPFSLAAGIEGHSGSRNLGSREEESEQFLDTGFSLFYEGKSFTADLSSAYTYHNTPLDDGFHQVLLELGIQFFGKRFDVSTGAGIHYDSEGSLLVPWSFSLQGVAGERWQFGLDAGFILENLLYGELWSEYPLLDLSLQGEIGTVWRYAGSLGYTLASDVQLNAGLAYEQRTGFPFLTDQDNRDPSSGLFPFMLQDENIFISDVGINYSSGTGTELKARWTGRFRENTGGLEPAHSILAEMRYTARERGFTLGMTGEYTIDPTSTLPLIELELGYKISQGITLLLVGSDLAGPFYDGGRPWWGEYEQRGFNLTLKTEISL